MAGIEKVCEYSGEYPGWKMYGYKHNQLQVMPKYRELFRNQKHVLVIAKSQKRMEMFGGTCTIDNYHDEMKYLWRRDQVAFNKFKGAGWYRYNYKPHREYQYPVTKCKFVQEYYFCLYVPNLQGEVEGYYVNWSFDIKTVKRKMKRILRTDLNVFEVDAIPEGSKYVSTEILRNECQKRYNEIYGEMK